MTDGPKLEWSHGRARITQVRPSDGGPPALPEAGPAEPMQDAKTGRFVPGNRAYRRRQVRERAKGIATLDPKRCASWLKPFVDGGATHGLELLQRFTDPALTKLVGNVADAHTVYRALLHLAAQGDTEALKESRAWLREYRSCLSTLSALSGGGHAGADGADDAPWVTSTEATP